MRLIFKTYSNIITVLYCHIQNNFLLKPRSAGDVSSTPHKCSNSDTGIAGRLQPFECFQQSQNEFSWDDFTTSGREKSHKDSSQANNEAEEPQECFTGQKILYWNFCVTRSIIVMQYLFVFYVWSHTNDPFLKFF
jgi:hypothetical protein